MAREYTGFVQTRETELGYFAHPDEGVHPGLVMIHDVWSLSDHYKDLARRLADRGFGVLALDVYRREPSLEIEDPGAWMRALNDPQVESDIAEAVRFLKAQPATEKRAVGALGFCMGGMYALLAGCGVRGIAAVAPFYGLLSHEHGLLFSESGLDPVAKPRSPLQAVRELSCPALAFFGAEDDFIPLSDVEELKRNAAHSGQALEAVVYPGAGHAFMNETRPEAYRPEAAREAWERMTQFFQGHLAGD